MDENGILNYLEGCLSEATGLNRVVSQDLLNAMFYYDEDSGKLYHKLDGNKHSVGDYAFKLNKRPRGTDYYVTSVKNRRVLTHRIIWCMVNGYFPEAGFEIDHINGDGLDNRLENLREVEVNINARNSKRRSNNTSGKTGVRLDKRRNKWCAYITDMQGQFKHLGSFNELDDAISARESAEELYGYTGRCK